MAKTKLITVIDCPICKASEAIRVYDTGDLFEVNCWECGVSTSVDKSLVEDDEAYNYYKTLVVNNCVDMSLNGRLYTKTVFSVMASMRNENFWNYLSKLPDAISVGVCPNCGWEIFAKHYPWDSEYRVNCYGCGFKTSIHEDTVFERVKENMSKNA
jgi:Zn ribbon nucleic-acid-binding protein